MILPTTKSNSNQSSISRTSFFNAKPCWYIVALQSNRALLRARSLIMAGQPGHVGQQRNPRGWKTQRERRSCSGGQARADHTGWKQMFACAVLWFKTNTVIHAYVCGHTRRAAHRAGLFPVFWAGACWDSAVWQGLHNTHTHSQTHTLFTLR